MRLLEEVYIKAEKDGICQKCGIDIPEGSNQLLGAYTSSEAHFFFINQCSDGVRDLIRAWHRVKCIKMNATALIE